MSHTTVYTLIGLFLFATGLIALFEVSSPSPADQRAIADHAPSSAPAAPDLGAGMGRAVEQALAGSGRAGALSADEMSQLPPQVHRLLSENRVVLTVPTEGAG